MMELVILGIDMPPNHKKILYECGKGIIPNPDYYIK